VPGVSYLGAYVSFLVPARMSARIRSGLDAPVTGGRRAAVAATPVRLPAPQESLPSRGSRPGGGFPMIVTVSCRKSGN
jgi:hypothetical protein